MDPVERGGEVFWRRSPERYLTLHYEDFVANPRGQSSAYSIWPGSRQMNLRFIDRQKVELATTHTVSGTPSRFKTGTAQLATDNEWRTKMRWRDSTPVTALTWQLLLGYGYLRSGRRSTASSSVRVVSS